MTFHFEADSKFIIDNEGKLLFIFSLLYIGNGRRRVPLGNRILMLIAERRSVHLKEAEFEAFL